MKRVQKRKVGRPANPNRAELQKKRRFLPLEKTDDTIALIKKAHAAYVDRYGKDTTDAEVLRDALRQYLYIR
jgi:hypothetical protein